MECFIGPLMIGSRIITLKSPSESISFIHISSLFLSKCELLSYVHLAMTTNVFDLFLYWSYVHLDSAGAA